MKNKRRVKVLSAIKEKANEYKQIYFISVEIEGHETGLLGGKKQTSIGIDVLSGVEILNVIGRDFDCLDEVRAALKNCK